MKFVMLPLVALSAMTCTNAALAKTPSVDPVFPVPIGSPGEWITSNDYPATALRFEMTGITAFRLTVDAAGIPNRCEIVSSSGFDVLDRATCDRVMVKARFSPARDRKRQPVEGVYLGRIRWVMPEDRTPPAPVSEFFVRALLTIDQAGKTTACQIAREVPKSPAAPAEQDCTSFPPLPPSMGTEIRGNSQAPAVEAEVQTALVFTPELRARILAPRPGYEQRALYIYRFTVKKDGTQGQCNFEEQRGAANMINDTCRGMAAGKFDPPFSALDKDGVATGWQIFRVLVKTGQ